MSKFSQHCGEGRHTKKTMYTFLLFESHNSYAISDSKLVCTLINKFFKHLYGQILDRKKISSLGIVLKPCIFFLGKVHLKRLGHLGVNTTLGHRPTPHNFGPRGHTIQNQKTQDSQPSTHHTSLTTHRQIQHQTHNTYYIQIKIPHAHSKILYSY